MDRILALQNLASFELEAEGAQSNTSGTCSDTSSGTGFSTCSINCGGTDTMEW